MGTQSTYTKDFKKSKASQTKRRERTERRISSKNSSSINGIDKLNNFRK